MPADPFDFSSADPAAPGFLGQPVGFWRSLAAFGGNLAAQANARTAGGFLANGTGLASPLGAAVGQTMEMGRQNALTRSVLAHQGAETQGLQIQNQFAGYGLPFEKALSEARMRALGGMTGNVTGPPGLGAAEGGNNPAAVNSGGFSGQYQFGAPRLAELGLYQPAQGEPLNSNKWTGQFNIPGFPDVKTQADFLKNPQAQNAAYQIHMANIDQAIKATPGAESMDPNGLRAVAHLGGVQGMQRFIQTGGQYNPADANGTSLMDYYRKFSGAGATSPASGPRVASAPPQAPYQIAGPSGTPPPTVSGTPPQQTQAASPQQQLPSTQAQPPSDAAQLAAQYRAQAAQMLQQANNAALLGHGIMGDPAALRARAAELQKQADALTTAGPLAAAKGAAEFPFKTERVNPGGVLSVGGKPAFSVPQRSEEVLLSGPNAGTQGQVYRDPLTGAAITPPATEPSQPGMPGGFMPTHLSPQQHGLLANVPAIQKNFIEHDNKVVDEDLSHVIENVIPAKQQLFQLRALNPDASTGAAGEFRMNFKNWVQTFAPDYVSQITGDASPAQEFKKIALMGAGKQERGDLGARGGFRAIELYLHANPSLENQPTANHDMANALLVSHQMHEDYATGATDFFNKQVQGVQDPAGPKPYTKLSVYDQQFIQKMRPELYAAAIGAINGKPYADWSKNLTGPQMRIVGGILQRADPSAQINIKDRMVPVNAFKTTIGPMDIIGSNDGR